MYKKFVASFMTALMAAMTLVSPAMAATALNTYPSFLGKVGDFYVVVGGGTAARTSDVAGAIDVASNLAQLSYKDTTTSGTTSSGLTGIERKIGIPADTDLGQVAGPGGNNLPRVLRNFHFNGLKEGQYEYRGTKHNYHEEVELDDSGTNLQVSHDTASPINGTLKLRIDNNATTFKYVFDDAIATGDFGPATSANTSTYQTPVKVTVAGREFSIVAIPSTTSFIALVGNVKTLSDGESLVAGDLTFKVVQSFASTTAKIEITDPSGNVIKSGINTGSTESISYGGSTYNYRVLSSGATASGVAGYAQVLAGKGDIEKTFDGGAESTVAEYGSDWKISGVFATAGLVSRNDYIKVAYEPASLTDAVRYKTAGSVFTGPNNYFELKYVDYTPSKFAKVTLEGVTGITVYSSTAATGYTTWSGLNGLKVSSDVAGTIVNGTTGYDEAYILFNASNAATNFSGFYWLAFKDKSTGRITNVSTAYPLQMPTSQPAASNVTLTLSYGGPGATKTYTLFAELNNETLLGNVTIGNASVAVDQGLQVIAEFNNKSAASTTAAPTLQLGSASGTVNANDVRVRIGDSSGNRIADVSDQVGTVIADDGVQVYTVKSNVEGDKVVLGIPPETVYGLIQFGKTSGTTTTTTGGTVKEVVEITAAVAKLDSEVSSTDKTGKHLVLVGGPCANTLVADLKTSGKFAYGCSDWPSRNFAVIEVVDNAFATGKMAVVVAGTRAEDTRLASSVLQSHDSKLSGITASKVEVTGTALASATVTPA